MDNYATLLQQFHLQQQQQTATHEQYVEIIDDIRNLKQSKQSLILRKKQQKDKFMLKTNRNNQKPAHPNDNVMIDNDCFQEQLRLEEINNYILKKELQNIEKQVCQSRKSVNQIENQLSVFARKDNQIKQLKYSSKRQLENAQMETKNQKLINLQLQQKHERVIDQLNSQRSNLEHQNRYLADRLNQMKSKTKNLNFLMTGMFKTGVMLEQTCNSFQCFKIQQIYTKKKLQQTLRILFILFVLKKQQSQLSKRKSFLYMKQVIQKQLKPNTYFLFLSKIQIFQYYLPIFEIDSFKSISTQVIQFYKNLCKNIGKLENLGTQLNSKFSELKQENQNLDKIIQHLQCDKQKNTILMITQTANFIKQIKVSIKDNSRFIFRIIQKYYNLLDRIKRLIETLNNIIEQKSQINPKFTSSNFQFHKKLQSLTNKQKRISANVSTSSKNITEDTLTSNFTVNLTKTNSSILSNRLNLIKKSSNQSCRVNTGNHLSVLSNYEQLLFRNPKQIIFEWYDVIKNGVDGANLLQTILQNDLYRIFFGPKEYNCRLGQLQNEEVCYTKVYEDIQKIITHFKVSLIQCLKSVIQGCKQLSQKNKYLIIDSSGNETRFVIQSKGYFRRDNFKLLEKLQLIQMKKKGLYVPYRYGVDVQQEMLSERNKKQLKLDLLDKNKQLINFRTPRNTAPNAANYLSSHRQKLNKANRKIRDLLRNADTLRLKRNNKKDKSSLSSQSIQSCFLIN